MGEGGGVLFPKIPQPPRRAKKGKAATRSDGVLRIPRVSAPFGD
jgi:hypothetical protein